MPICECFNEIEIDSPRNIIVSVISAVLFTLGWWIIIDAACLYSNENLPHSYYAVGVFTTFSFVFINMIPTHALQDDFSSRQCGQKCAYVSLFLAFVIAFSCVIASIWIFFGAYVAVGKTPLWPGIAILLQNLFICISSFLYRFGRKVEEF